MHEHGWQHHEDRSHEVPGPPSAPVVDDTSTVAETAVETRPKGAKRGPKPMVDRDTMRVEAQLYPEQFTAAMTTLARLKIEHREVPRSERRRFTVNTLIRVSMTVLLEHADELHGRTEEELLACFRECLGRGSR